MVIKRFFYIFLALFVTTTQATIKPTIVFLHHDYNAEGGMENHIITSVEHFIANGHKAVFVTAPHTPAEVMAKKRGIPYELCTGLRNRKIFHNFLRDLCNRIHPDIIISINNLQLAVVDDLKKEGFPIKSIFKMHIPNLRFTKYLGHTFFCDGIIYLNPNSGKEVAHYDVPSICVPSFFSPEPFASYKTTFSKDEMLKHAFGVQPDNRTVLCMVANFYPGNNKNHPLLVEALKKVKFEYGDSFICLLAGSGGEEEKIKKLVQQAGLEQDIVFLGYTKMIPELLYCSDIHVLASQYETFGIAHVEAGLMSRPTIGATGTGADIIIQPGKTGLIFENRNAHDLAEKIHTLIADKKLREEMGKNARMRVLTDLGNDQKYQAHADFFDLIINGKKNDVPA